MENNKVTWLERMPKVGDIAEMSRQITADDINLFSSISGDFNPLHYDAVAASRTRFGQIIVQGGVTTAILNAVVAEKIPGPGSVFLSIEWKFINPTRPGDLITGRVEVTAVRSDKPITHLKTSVIRQDGEVCVEGTAVCYTVDL